MNAAAVAAALAGRAEEVCRRYLPRGRRSGRYWVAGDVRGARGRSLFVRLAPPGTPGKWTDSATAEHGDLLDLVRIASGAGSLRAALAEARAFLALPPMPAPAGPDTYDRTEAARRLWRRCRAIDGTHAEAYLRARHIHRCRFPALRFHPSLMYRDEDGARRLPALVAAVTGDDGAIEGVHRTWIDPSHPAKAPVARPRKALGRVHGLAVRFGAPAAGTLLVGEGVGSGTGAPTVGSGGCSVAFAPGLSPAPVVTFPAPASSNPAYGFPVLGSPAAFVSRFMWPFGQGALSARGRRPDNLRTIRAAHTATAYSTSSSQTPGVRAVASGVALSSSRSSR